MTPPETCARFAAADADQAVADFNAALERWFDAYDACLASLIAQRDRQRAELDALRDCPVGQDRQIVEVK